MKDAIMAVIRRCRVLSEAVALVLLAGATKNSMLRKAGWFRSFASGRSVDGDGEPIPWYTYPAIRFLEERVRCYMRVLELGGGNSTLWWAKWASMVMVIEHNPKWEKHILASAPDNVLVNASTGYCNYHVIVVDSLDREKCTITAMVDLTDDGVIICDNSDRDNYGDAFNQLHQNGFKRLDFWGMSPINTYELCTSIFYRDGNCLGI